MAQEFKIGRLRYTWRGVWNTGVTYNRDAITQYEGKMYICLEPHTAQSNFYNDLNYITPGGASTPRWLLTLDGRIWKDDWQPLTSYSLGNIVKYGGVVYVCTTPHTSGTQEIEIANFATYANFDKWNTDWTTSTVYGIGDIVRYGGIVYRCTFNHISAATVEEGIEVNLSQNNFDYLTDDDSTLGAWEVVNEGIEYKGAWAVDTRYKKNDVVKNGSNLYITTVGNTGVEPFDYNIGSDSAFDSTFTTKWEIWQPGTVYKDTWSPSETYQIGDLVQYGGYSYTSKIQNNLNYIPSVTAEYANDVRPWELATQGYNMRTDWNSGTEYLVGDVVRQGGYLYAAIDDSIGENPSSLSIQTSYTAAGSSGTTIKVGSSVGITPGMIISGNGFTQGQTVVSVPDATTVIANEGPNGAIADDDSLTFIGVNYVFWSIVAPGKSWTGFWENDFNYVFGELVVYGNATYRCVQNHTSGSISRPDVAVSEWIVESYHARKNAGTVQGDIVTRAVDNNIAVAITNQPDENGFVQSTEDFTFRVNNTRPAWANILEVPDVYFVTEDGVDANGYGKSIDKPWASIKYACEQVAKGTFYQNTNTILLANKEFLIEEMYAWMLNQQANSIAPFSPSSVFDEVTTKRDAKYIIDALSYDITRGGNTRTVAAARAYFKTTDNTSFRNTATDLVQDFIFASLTKLSGLLVTVLANEEPIVNYQIDNITWDETATYVQDDIVLYNDVYYQNNIPSNTGEIPGEAFTWDVIADPGLITAQDLTTGVVQEPGTAELIQELIYIPISAIQYADKTLIPQSIGSETSTINVKTGTYHESLPIIVPDNVAINGDELRGATVFPAKSVYTVTLSSNGSNQFLLASVENLEVNDPIQFSAAGLNDDFGSVTLGTTYYVTEIDGKYIKISGTVGGSTFAVTSGTGNMTVYAGDCLKDMFYVRNASGIRNVTLSGLAGSLTAPNSFGTRRPTGGSYVSLDPGTGPDDTNVWITKRSPYIQNVTNFGVGAVGLKIDGYLHNGGNKSIVCNDFTQIISDGIGVYCVGPDSLTECVSVFSYYNYSGYFAEDGGRIRATNGNSSYGQFGVIAEGFDPTEVPISGVVDNQSTQVQASVQSAFGTSAELLSMQYANAGSNYFEQTTNLLAYSNNFIETWTTDGNVLLQQNTTSPNGETNAWTFNAQTSTSDSSFIYQDVTIPVAGKVYTNLPVLNVTGSGSGASFDITVGSTSYSAVVNGGGSGYVVGNVVRILGSQLGGLDGTNDCFLTVQGLAGSAILSVSVSGTVPEGSARPYTFSTYIKKGTVSSIDLDMVFGGNTSVTSNINFNFDTKLITPSNAGTSGLVPESYGLLELVEGWYRLWITAYDITALNNSLRVKIYPRGRNGFIGYTRFYGTQLQISSAPTFYLETNDTRHTANADYFITGAGTGVEIEGNETRSKSVFNTRITDPGSGAGGRGYLTASNNAQAGNSTSITIAQADINEAVNYNSMRMFIQSGTGAGQYGYISYYDSATKNASILKESFTPLDVIESNGISNEFITSSNVETLYVNQPVQFIPTYYSTSVNETSTDVIGITETIGGSTNTLICVSTAKLKVNDPLQFTGAVFGGVTTGFTYYIKEIIDGGTFTISTEPFGTKLLLNSATGAMNMIFPGYNSYLSGSTTNMTPNMPITFTGSAIGGITVGTQYYVNDVLDFTKFTVSSALVTADVTATANTTNYITASSTSGLIPLNPISFSGEVFGGLTAGQKYYINSIVNSTTFTVTQSLINVKATATTTITNLITVESTANFVPNNPIVFRGNTFGNIANETVYYILAINDATTFTVSLSPGGSAVNLITASGDMAVFTPNALATLSTDAGTMTATTTNAKTTLTYGIGAMNGTYSTSLFGNVVAGTTYYVRSITPGAPNSTFDISTTPGGAAVALKQDLGAMNLGALGWDHINPGTAIAASLDNSTVYYIEPRIQYSGPNFTQSGSTTSTISPSNVWTAIAYGDNKFIAIPDGNAVASSTTNGTSWTSVALPVSTTWTDIAYGNDNWVIISNDSSPAQTGSTVLVSAAKGNGWRPFEMPSKTSWSNIEYGNGRFVAIASGTTTSAYSSTGGTTWTGGSGLPSANWTGLAYGAGKFVAISNGQTFTNVATTVISSPGGSGATFDVAVSGTTYNLTVNAGGAGYQIGDTIRVLGTNVGGATTANDATITVTGIDILNGAIQTFTVTGTPASIAVTTAYSSNGGTTWSAGTMPASSNWTSVAFGAGLFVAVSAASAASAYSRDGITWTQGTIPLPGCLKVVYGQGVFLALTSSGTVAYSSEDGATWISRTVTNDGYRAAAFGFTANDNDGIFVTASQQTVGSKIELGCTTKGRVTLASGRINGINIWEPGSNYTSNPVITVTDPNITLAAELDPRSSNGVLGNPTFINRGTGYNTNSTAIRINGGGFADTFQTGLIIIVDNLSTLPGPGDNLEIAGNNTVYKVTNATVVFGTEAPNIKANISVSPEVSVAKSPSHNTAITIRQKYSQARLTGHDFLNVGYGNQVDSNYPGVPADTVLAPQDQAVEVNFGRVFYVSTDQDGNFKVGDLFGVEQATGIVTVSASQFGLEGLETLSLGGISVGGSSVVVRQFSTDSTFIANSNEVIPTQRAIKAYLTGRLSQGGSNTFTGQLIAGTVLVGGPNIIRSTIPNGQTGSVVNMPTLVTFNGQYTGWDGGGAAMAMFLQSTGRAVD